ncbi:MAG: sulfotransferase family protein [Acidimicrobiales bacterium]
MTAPTPTPAVAPLPMFVGCGRSGTTLVRAIFDSHSQLAVAHHAQFIVSMGRHRRRYEGIHGLRRERFLSDLFASHRFAHLQLNRDEVRDLFATPVPSFPTAVRRVLAHFAERQGKTRYADKTPGHVVRIQLLSELFGEARFVHIIRDGRNSWVGYRDRGFGPKTVADAAFNWKGRVARGRCAGLALGPERYLEVRYEELVERPAETLDPVCRFLGLEFEESMLGYHERAGAILAGLDPADRGDFENLFRPLTKGVRDWRTEMSSSEQAVFDAIAGELLADLGYERSRPAARATAKVDVARGWLGWQARRVAFRTTLVGRRLSKRGSQDQPKSEPTSS